MLPRTPFQKTKLFFLFLIALFLVETRICLAQATGGIGVILEFVPEKKIHRVRAVFQNSPASRAKVQPGDEIVSVDGASTEKMSFEELGKKVRGAPGQPVTLVLRTAGTQATREVRLVRASAHKVSPLITTPSGSSAPSFPSEPRPAKSQSPVLSESEKSELKNAILKLKTPEQRQQMEQLLTRFQQGKISKAELLRKVRGEF